MNLRVHQSRPRKLWDLYRTKLNCLSVSSLRRINSTSRNDPTAWKRWYVLAWYMALICFAYPGSAGEPTWTVQLMSMELKSVA
jgi:hypothetical protein